MLQRFRKFINEEKLFSPRDRVLLAVSGGMDSSAMAWLFHKSGYYFGIAHFNFSLREMESDGDEYFVKELAAKYEVPFYSRRAETKEYAQEKGISVQMAARELRYGFFEEIAGQQDYQCIATAHHRDDETETFFINLFRSTGISGLHGIKSIKGNIIRPMLFASRGEIEKLVKSENIRYREDSSNKEDKYLRNKIRHILMPALEKIDPDFSDTMKGNFRRLRQAEAVYRSVIESKAAEAILYEEERIVIPFGRIKELDPLPAFLYEFLSPYGFNEDNVHGIIGAISGTPGRFFYSDSHRALVDRDRIIITELNVTGQSTDTKVLIEAHTTEIERPVRLVLERFKAKPGFVIPVDPNTACMDADQLKFPLHIRKWEKGDVFYPLGARGRKKLSDFFTDHKFSRLDKENCWLLCSGESIIWVIGHRLAQPVRVTQSTKNIYCARLKEE